MASISTSVTRKSAGQSTLERDTLTEERSKWAQQQAQHKALVSLVLSKATRIRKESKSRKHKDLHGSMLDDAVDALTSFQEEEWPPKPNLDELKLPDWMDGQDKQNPLTEMPNLSKQNGHGSEDSPDNSKGETSPSSKFSTQSFEDTKQLTDVDVEECETEATKTSEENSTATNQSQAKSNGEHTNTSNRPNENMHESEIMNPSVITALQAFCLVMRSNSKTPRMCELSLDCITLLFTNGYISGVAGITPNNNAKGEQTKSDDDEKSQDELLEYLIESITRCSESTFEGVHTAMTKALLSSMTSSKCGIHEAALLICVRATFHVYLVSKSANTKELSKATLLDMLKVVYNRMEAYDAVAKSNRISQQAKQNNAAEKGEKNKKEENGAEDSSQNENPKINGNGVEVSAFASRYHTDGYLLFRALCKLSAKALPGEDKAAGPSNTNTRLLQSFAAAPVVDPLALLSKELSLELILSVFEHCGEAFKTGDKFIYAVQNYLCVSLLKNCMSVHTHVAFLSLKIFLILLYHFKSHLKSEIEVFVANIFLRVLESPNSSLDQKALVIEALRALCSDPLMLTQLFLNYDCDFDAVDLYKSIVHNLTRLCGKSRSVAYSNKKDASEETALCRAGLEVLVVILRAFLKVLGLPGGDDEIGNSMSTLTSKSLHLDIGNIGLAVASEDSPKKIKDDDVASDSDSIYDRDLEIVSPRSEDNAKEAQDVAGKIVDAFDRKRTVQANFETGCIKFTLSLKPGILYFIENGFLTLDAREVALFFLKNKDRLDKTQIGEVLGREPESAFIKDPEKDVEKGGKGFYVRVLHHYVYAMDFSSLEFDEAIRHFLSGFRLPGEAQKIDRIMEKFAERFTRQNEDVFPSADTAFILAFSVIMLNTDLHNPSIKPEKRMTLESFIRNNRGISVDGGDLPEEFLGGVFKRIQANAFSLKEDDDAREKENTDVMTDTFFVFESRGFFGTSAEERKREKFRQEREEMMSASEQLFKKRPHKNRDSGSSALSKEHAQLAESVSPADVVKPMFDVTWGPLIGTLAQMLETSEDNHIISLCLNGFVYSVRIASHSNMSLARDTFVNALTKFTTLGSIKEMQLKNIESIQTLLSIAIIDGEFLGESWGPVLQCISQLARLQLFASGLDEDDTFLSAGDKGKKREDKLGYFQGVDKLGYFRQNSLVDVNRETEEKNAGVVLAAVNEILIDKVFSSTVNLSALSMIHFIEQLINVSAAEISCEKKKNGMGIAGMSSSQHSAPRIFALQKLVEVADYNMDARPRIAWTKMWDIMAKHFATIGCHENAMVSMFAIDALRQLSFKFLEKPELHDFNFQRVFLKPFLLIMENPGSREDIRELVLRCVDNMIRSLSHNLRSGWKICFSILILSAGDDSNNISTLGLAILQRLLDEHLGELCRRSCTDEFGDNALTTEVEEDPQEMSSLQRKMRNANAEDFVGLCYASLSFVQIEESENPLPIGLSMRALCHTACYADLIANKRVLPPVFSQSTDPLSFGYTYEGLESGEAEEMALWRPLLDGLSAGICSTTKSNSGGVGCLVQRGSAMTLRAILLRHGNMFSVSQWAIILSHVVLPAMQSAAECDETNVAYIISESPSVSSLDFLADPLPLPPPPDDEGLIKFATTAMNAESAPSRPLGPVELLVEASFADLRHGGDCNLSRAHGLKKRSWSTKTSVEQPFPDSWVSTTAPLVLGMLTDLIKCFFLDFGAEGRDILWPIILGQFQLWMLGPRNPENNSDDVSVLDNDYFDPFWRPCEALVRISCKEFNRILQLFSSTLDQMDNENAVAWWKLCCSDFADILSQNVALEVSIHEELVESKLAALQLKENGSTGVTEQVITEQVITGLTTPYGRGRLLNRREDCYEHDGASDVIPIWEVALEWGATLYGPEDCDLDGNVSEKVEESSVESIEDENASGAYRDDDSNSRVLEPQANSVTNIISRLVPALKVRCIAAHLLQQNFPNALNKLVGFTGEEEAGALIKALKSSQEMACKANRDEDLSHAFQEAARSEWGDGVEEVEKALAAASGNTDDINRGECEMFFLTQESGANRAIIRLLSLFYCPEFDHHFSEQSWDRKHFSEPILLDRIQDVLRKFLHSEEKDGHKIDPNVWLKASENGGKVPFFCTSFAGVVVIILNTVQKFGPEQFVRHKHKIYPILCSLIRVQSDEIRLLVSDILLQQVGPLLDIDVNSNAQK